MCDHVRSPGGCLSRMRHLDLLAAMHDPVDAFPALFMGVGTSSAEAIGHPSVRIRVESAADAPSGGRRVRMGRAQ